MQSWDVGVETNKISLVDNKIFVAMVDSGTAFDDENNFIYIAVAMSAR
jgi:hypothetical protein